MAYRKFADRILAGSLNWLPSTDMVPQPDVLDNSNFRVDQANILTTRQGTSSLGTAGSNPIRTVLKALGTRYQASDAIYRNFVSVSSSWSGNTVGWAEWKGWVWFLDRSKSGKDDGTNFRNFSITAPSGACVAAKGTEYQKNISTFDSSETFSFDPTGLNSFDGATKQEGTHSLLMEVTSENVITITRVVSLDLSTYSGQTAHDDDKHRIWIYASKFKKLDAITLRVDVSSTAGTFQQYYEVRLPRLLLMNGARKGWRRFFIRRAEKLEGRTTGEGTNVRTTNDGLPVDDLPFFTRVGGDTTRNWSTVTAIQIVLDTRAAVDVRFDLWDVYGSNTALIEGQSIDYAYTYANDSEHESNPSPFSTPVAIDKTTVALSSLTASADAQVTKKYIYRRGGQLPDFYRVSNTGVANATTTYTDTASDETVLALGVIMEDDLDAPPSAAGLIGPYLNRLVSFSTAAAPARLFWSKFNKPWAWPGASSSLDGNWEDIGATNESIVWVTHRQNQLWIYKENTIWRMVGDPDTADIEITRSPYGLIGRRAVAYAGDVDYFQFKEGLARFDGSHSMKISTKLDPIFKGQTVTLASGVTIPPVDASNRANACMEFINDRLYFSYPSDGQTNPDVTLVYDIPSDRWYRYSLGFTALNYEGQNGVLQGGRSNGAVLQLETGTTDSASAIPVIFQSRYMDQGFPDLEKTYQDLTIDANTGGNTVTATAYLNDSDGASTSVSLGTFSSSTRTRHVLQFNTADPSVEKRGRNISIRLTGSGVITFYDFVVNGYLEARQAKTFDSDEVAFSNGRVSRLRELRLDMDNASSVTVFVYSDLPGHAMAIRNGSGDSVGASTTRRVEPIIVGTTGSTGDPIGFLHRVVVSGSDFKLYGAQALYQTIGTYLIGSKDEFYQSDPLDFGTERIKLIKELEIDYELTGATATIAMKTDQPGDALATRTGFSPTTLSTTTAESVSKIRLPGTIKGRLFQLTITPAASGLLTIYAIRAWVKTLGEPNASPWTWMDLPVVPTGDNQWFEFNIPPDAADL